MYKFTIKTEEDQKQFQQKFSSADFELDHALVIFDPAVSEKNVLKVLDTLYDVEEKIFEQSKIYGRTEVRLKGVDKSILTNVLRQAIHRETLVNLSMCLNLNLLISGYASHDPVMFASKDVFFSDIEGILDAKLDLAEDLDFLQTNVARWYFSCQTSMHKVEYTYLDQMQVLPNLYRCLIGGLTMVSLSSIMRRTMTKHPEALQNVPFVENAYPLMLQVAGATSAAAYLSNSILAPIADKVNEN